MAPAEIVDRLVMVPGRFTAPGRNRIDIVEDNPPEIAAIGAKGLVAEMRSQAFDSKVFIVPVPSRVEAYPPVLPEFSHHPGIGCSHRHKKRIRVESLGSQIQGEAHTEGHQGPFAAAAFWNQAGRKVQYGIVVRIKKVGVKIPASVPSEKNRI